MSLRRLEKILYMMKQEQENTRKEYSKNTTEPLDFDPKEPITI